jgi:hypothetical protein
MKEKDVRDRYLNTVTINTYNYLWLTTILWPEYDNKIITKSLYLWQENITGEQIMRKNQVLSKQLKYKYLDLRRICFIE